MPHSLYHIAKKKKKRKDSAAISEMVSEKLIYWGSSLHVVEWSSFEIQAVLSVFPSYANVQLSRGWECLLWAHHNHLTESVLWDMRTKRTGNSLLRTNCFVRFMLQNSNKTALETHPTRNFLNCSCWHSQGVLSQNGPFLTTQNVRSEASES